MLENEIQEYRNPSTSAERKDYLGKLIWMTVQLAGVKVCPAVSQNQSNGLAN